MDKIQIRKAEIEDCKYLAENLRDEDLRELKNVGVDDFYNCVLSSFEVSKESCFTLLYQGKISLMFGVRKMDFDGIDLGGIIWLLSTNEVKKFPFSYYKLARKYIEQFKNEYKYLYNFIDLENKESLKLLSNCGANFYEGFRSEKTNREFLKFDFGDLKNV